MLLGLFCEVLRRGRTVSPHASARSLFLQLFGDGSSGGGATLTGGGGDGGAPFELDRFPALESSRKSSSTLLLELVQLRFQIDVRLRLAELREENLLTAEKNELAARKSDAISRICVLATRPGYFCTTARLAAVKELQLVLPPLSSSSSQPAQTPAATAALADNMLNAYFDFHHLLLSAALDAPKRRTPAPAAVELRPATVPAVAASVARSAVSASATVSMLPPAAPIATTLPSRTSSPSPSPVLSGGAAAVVATPLSTPNSQPQQQSGQLQRPTPPSQQTQATHASLSTPPTPPPVANPWRRSAVAASMSSSSPGPASRDVSPNRAVAGSMNPNPTSPFAAASSSGTPSIAPTHATHTPAKETNLWEYASSAPISPTRPYHQLVDRRNNSRRWVLHLLRQLRPMLDPPSGASGVPPSYVAVRARYTKLLQAVDFGADPHGGTNLGLALAPASTQMQGQQPQALRQPQQQLLARAPQMALFNSAW
jgi:hypothetical protein